MRNAFLVGSAVLNLQPKTCNFAIRKHELIFHFDSIRQWRFKVYWIWKTVCINCVFDRQGEIVQVKAAPRIKPNSCEVHLLAGACKICAEHLDLAHRFPLLSTLSSGLKDGQKYYLDPPYYNSWLRPIHLCGRCQSGMLCTCLHSHREED